jgi:UDP-N-acetylmuramate: L-alanyl-gamma-D-glutamyl-meso-diaminopimelate ligase
MSATIVRKGRAVASGSFPVVGYHNLLNALAAVAVADRAGIEPRAAVDALGSFRGVRRRQELVAEESGILIVDDFAHHPTEVKETCSGVHSRFPDRRLIAVFEPRTNTSRRAVFQKTYVGAFSSADVVVLREPGEPEKFPVEDRFSSQALASDLKTLGKRAVSFDNGDGVLAYLGEEVREGDVVLFMSSGSFENLASRLGAILKERRA